jgi:double-stranded uracil-DNA glycosylase
MTQTLESAVPDYLGPESRIVFCGINPGEWSARAKAPFANPRNDFWRLLHAAGFTPRVLDPQEAPELVLLGLGLTNAAGRTTKGSDDEGLG